MSAYPNPSCSECEEAIHVYCKKKSDEKFKLLEQAHCAKCWRPLYYNTNWPGSYESLRPPFYSPLQPLRLSVAQCGHIFHTQCIVESRSDNHCPSCFSWIQSLRPLHYHNISSNAPTQMPPIGNTKPEFGSSTLNEVQNSRAKCEDDIMDLKKKIGHLTSEVERLQRHLDTNNIRKPWR